MNRRSLLGKLAKLGGGSAIALAVGEMVHKNVGADSCHYEWITKRIDSCHAQDIQYRVCYSSILGTWSYTVVYRGAWYCTCPYPNPCG